MHLGFADTLRPSSAQAFALTENNLYTVEAFDEYFDHLRPERRAGLSRPCRLVGDEALRVTVLALEALRRRGVAHPERNVVVAAGPATSSASSSARRSCAARRGRRPSSTACARLAPSAARASPSPPAGPYQHEWARAGAAPSAEAFCASYRLDVCAPTDDKPFFFQMRRLGSLGRTGAGYLYTADPFLVLLVTFGILRGARPGVVAAPLVLTRGATGRRDRLVPSSRRSGSAS